MNLRKIDRLVAEKVLKQETRIKWVVTQKKYEYKFYNVNGDEIWLPLPKYSTDIKDAWQVVEKLRDRYVYIDLTNNDDLYCCELMEQDWENESRYFTYYADAETAPLAICLAALKAVGVEVEVTE
jgi:hypothetical protein